jgi:hypothetical protein
VLVVVDFVSGVAVVPVDVVDVVQVGDGRMAAGVLVDVHVSGVRDVPDSLGGLLVDVIAVDEVDVAVVEEVHVILMGNGRMPAEAVVDMRVLIERMMRGPAGHRFLHPATVAVRSSPRKHELPTGIVAGSPVRV